MDSLIEEFGQDAAGMANLCSMKSGALAGKTEMARNNWNVWKYLQASFFTHTGSTWFGFTGILSSVGIVD